MNYFLIGLVVIIVVILTNLIIRRMTASPRSAETIRLDDQRFARLLITELRLYNQRAVQAGRENKDLYHRLKVDIDRSRQMYDERVGARAGADPDYFHEELVNELAGGDISDLGQTTFMTDCPV